MIHPSVMLLIMFIPVHWAIVVLYKEKPGQWHLMFPLTGKPCHQYHLVQSQLGLVRLPTCCQSPHKCCKWRIWHQRRGGTENWCRFEWKGCTQVKCEWHRPGEWNKRSPCEEYECRAHWEWLRRHHGEEMDSTRFAQQMHLETWWPKYRVAPQALPTVRYQHTFLWIHILSVKSRNLWLC